jgi:hypothetical protein
MDQMLKRILENPEAQNALKMRNAFAFAIRARRARLLQRLAAFIARGSEFERRQCNATRLTERHIAFTRCAADGAGAWVAEIEKWARQYTQFHGADCNNDALSAEI